MLWIYRPCSKRVRIRPDDRVQRVVVYPQTSCIFHATRIRLYVRRLREIGRGSVGNDRFRAVSSNVDKVCNGFFFRVAIITPWAYSCGSRAYHKSYYIIRILHVVSIHIIIILSRTTYTVRRLLRTVSR